MVRGTLEPGKIPLGVDFAVVLFLALLLGRT
jgi:hypothetical protein